MPFQGIHRVVGGADELDVGLVDQPADRHGGLRQLFVAELIDLVGGLQAQGSVIAEIPLELQVGPMVQGIAHSAGNGIRPGAELFLGVAAASHQLLRISAGPHDAPFVVVAEVAVAQPHLGDIGKLAVLIDLLGVDVAMVVDDGHLVRVIVEQCLCRFVAQEEVLVHEAFHLS